MDTEIKHQVREFYDKIGWQEASDGFYQNASYEDLRPVSHEYIHNCHLRVLRHLNRTGRFFLDAGSGPIQYPEYVEYSRGYQFRVCADISIVALQEARKRIGTHGLYVVGDIANLPFKSNTFDGAISLHTIHHLPPTDHIRAYQELHRTLIQSAKAVVVYGWDSSPLIALMNFWINMYRRLYALFPSRQQTPANAQASIASNQPVAHGTYVRKYNASWLQEQVGTRMPASIWCWRSLSVSFLRTFINERLAGKWLLKLIYALEELFPHFFGKYGQYPLIVLEKST